MKQHDGQPNPPTPKMKPGNTTPPVLFNFNFWTIVRVFFITCVVFRKFQTKYNAGGSLGWLHFVRAKKKGHMGWSPFFVWQNNGPPKVSAIVGLQMTHHRQPRMGCLWRGSSLLASRKSCETQAHELAQSMSECCNQRATCNVRL
jgi:hypothetical protein